MEKNNILLSHGIIHLYAQYAHHMDAFVLGNEKGLLALRDVINEAVYPGKIKSKVDVFCNDGEGYTIYVKVVPGVFHASTNDLPVPYTADYAQDTSGINLGEIYKK